MAFNPGDRVKLSYHGDIHWLVDCTQYSDRPYVRELISSGDPILGTVLRMQNGLVHVLFDGFMHVSRPEGRYQIDPEGFVLWVDPPKRSDEEIISTAEEAYLADGNPALETTDRNERCEALALAGYLDVNAWFLRNTVKLGIRITEKGKQSNVV